MMSPKMTCGIYMAENMQMVVKVMGHNLLEGQYEQGGLVIYDFETMNNSATMSLDTKKRDETILLSDKPQKIDHKQVTMSRRKKASLLIIAQEKVCGRHVVEDNGRRDETRPD
jgi:hypothetical protein